jgi:hypothetical protein
MIAALAFVAFALNPVTEVIRPDSRIASIQAIVRLPPMDRMHRDLLTVYANCLGQDTHTFSKNQIAELAGRVGSRFRVSILSDHIRLSLETVPADFSTGLSMMASAIKEPTVSQQDIDDRIADLQFRHFGYWREALLKSGLSLTRFSKRELDDTVAAIFRPENVWLGVSGKIEPGLSESKWSSAVADWSVPKVKASLGGESSNQISDSGSSLAVVDLVSRAYSASDAAFSTKLLALVALGTGKSSALWRVSRLEMRLSYRQEAVLWPTALGFEPRLLLVTSQPDELEKKSEELRTRLLEDIKGWTNDTRQTAIGVASGFLVGVSDLSPLYFAAGRPVGRDEGDQAFLGAYWQMKTGTAWNPYQLAGRLGFVDLNDLKQTATDMLTQATLRVRRPK